MGASPRAGATQPSPARRGSKKSGAQCWAGRSVAKVLPAELCHGDGAPVALTPWEAPLLALCDQDTKGVTPQGSPTTTRDGVGLCCNLGGRPPRIGDIQHLPRVFWGTPRSREVLWVLPWDATIFTPPALLVASSLCKTTGTKSQWGARHLVKGGNPLR